MPRIALRRAGLLGAVLSAVVACAVLLPASAGAGDVQSNKTVRSGREVRLYTAAYFNTASCQTTGMPAIKGIRPPAHGSVSTQKAPILVEDAGHPCHGRYLFGIEISYKSKAGYVGSDQTVFDVIYPDGLFDRVTATITVTR